MSSSVKYLGMNLRDLRKLCMEKMLPGITNESTRQQCLNALLEYVSKSPSTNRRRPLPNGRRDSRFSSHSHSPRRDRTDSTRSTRTKSKRSKSKRRARKRSRSELGSDNDDDGKSLSNNEERRKRRRTDTPSTMTTPERDRGRSLRSPVQNPRLITPIQAPLPESMRGGNYQSKDFLNMLDSDDDTDQDIDVINNNNSNNNHKSREQSKPIKSNQFLQSKKSREKPTKQSQPKKQKLQTLRGSSPEDNNQSDDDDNNYDSDESEPHSESSSESQDLSDDDYDRKVFKRKKKRYQKNHDDNKSRSRSRSTIKKKQKSKKPTDSSRSKSKPNYRYRPTPNTMSADIKTIAQRTMPHQPKPSHSKQSYSMPQTANISPIRPDQIISSSNPPMPFHSNISKKSQSSEPPSSSTSSFGARVFGYYQSIINSCKRIIDYILWLPLQIYKLIKFLWRNIIYICVIFVMIALLYSPTMKLIQDIDFKQATVDVLQEFIKPSIKYCDYDSWDHQDADDNDSCTLCPQNGFCAGGKFMYCNGDRTIIDGQCKIDPKRKQQLEDAMSKYSISLLSRLGGEKICQEYKLYNFLYSINEENDNILPKKGLKKDELAQQLANALQYNKESHLFQTVFDKFTQSIRNPGKDGLHLKELAYDEKIGYYSNKPSKSLICVLTINLSDNAKIIIPSMIFAIIIWIILCCRRYNQNKRARGKQLIQDKKEQVLKILHDHLNNSNKKWIPLLQVQFQIMGDTNNSKEWKRVEREVDKDANTQKSLQMIDGVQKLCWKLSETALIN